MEKQELLCLAIEESQKVHIKKLKTAKDYWNALKRNHEKSNLTNKVSLLRQLFIKKINTNKPNDGRTHHRVFKYC